MMELVICCSATEDVAARGGAVVIEKIRLTFEIDGAAMNRKRTGRLVGDAPLVVPRAVNSLLF